MDDEKQGVEVRTRGLTKKDAGKYTSTLTVTDCATGESWRESRTFCARSMAQAKREQQQHLIDVAKAYDKPGQSFVTVAQLVAEHIATKAATGTVEASTVASYRCNERLIVRDLGGSLACKLSPSQINQWMAGLLEEGRATSSIQHAYTLLNASFEYAVCQELVDRNPCRFCRPPKSKHKERQTLSAEEASSLAAVCKAALPDRVAGCTLVALSTGLRREEVCGLRFSDIDFDEKTLTVNRAIGVNHGKAYVKDPKNASSRRTIPIPDELHRALAALKADCDALLKARGETGDPYLFGTWRKESRYYDPTRLSKDFNAMKRLCGAGHVTFHDLRHTYATLCLRRGIDVITLSRLLGHSNPSTTANTYLHSDMSAMRQASDAINEALSGNQGVAGA